MALYVRVSTEEQAEHGYSIDAQLETLRGYCRALRKVIVEEYVERGVSGKSVEGRFELKRLLTDAKQGMFDEVLVWKISRMARKQLDLLKIVEFLSQSNVAFRSVSENFETETPTGKFALQMLGAVGELERNTIVDNVKMGMKHRARTGKWNGGIMLGYQTKIIREGSNRRDRQTELEIVPEEAATVRYIYELYASGQGLRAIANRLNREGYRTKKGKEFSPVGVSDILLNPAYIGKIRYNQHEDWSSKRRKGANPDPILVDGNHAPIVDPELWDKVQALHDMKGGKPPRLLTGKFPLTGIMRCPQCGYGMVAHNSKKRRGDGTVVVYRSYVCGRFHTKGSTVCGSNGVNAQRAEQVVRDRLRLALTKPSVLHDVVGKINEKRSAGTKPLEFELKSVNKTLDGLKAKQDKLYSLFEEDGIDKDTLLIRLNDLKEQLDRLSARKAELSFKLSGHGTAPVPVPVVKAVLSQFDRLMDSSPPDQQKTLIHLLVRRITVNRGKIDKIELQIDERIQQSFLREGPSGSPEGPFDFEGVLPLTITL